MPKSRESLVRDMSSEQDEQGLKRQSVGMIVTRTAAAYEKEQ